MRQVSDDLADAGTDAGPERAAETADRNFLQHRLDPALIRFLSFDDLCRDLANVINGDVVAGVNNGGQIAGGVVVPASYESRSEDGLNACEYVLLARVNVNVDLS